jgi:hypothetical protein
MKEYKYTTKFEYEVLASAGSIDGLNISEASLDNLSPLLPESVDLEKNIDLLGVAFNAAVVNRFNKNGDGIDSEAAIKIKDYFIHKPTNIEHNRDQVVGHIVSSGLSSFEDSVILTEKEASVTTKPFNISLAAVVYKTASPELVDMLESSKDSMGEISTVISTSWELGFNEYAVAVGSKNLEDCEILTGEAAESAKENLRAFGGDGKLEDGRVCNRLVIGEIIPLGVAFTTKPAADVHGVFVAGDEGEEVKADEAIQDFLGKKENKSSQISKTVVIEDKETVNTNIMDAEKLIKQLEALLNEKRRKNDFSEEAVASVSKLVNDVIIEKSTEWKSQVEEADTRRKEVEEAQADLSAKYDAMTDELKTAQEKLESLEKDNEEREVNEAFNARMEALSTAFDLNEEDLKIVASEIKDLEPSKESFAEYQSKFEKIWSHKSKEFLKSQAEELEAKIEAEVQKRLAPEGEKKEEDVVGNALENAEEQKEAIPNNNSDSAESETLRDKFEAAFSGDNVTIKY